MQSCDLNPCAECRGDNKPFRDRRATKVFASVNRKPTACPDCAFVQLGGGPGCKNHYPTGYVGGG